MDAGDFRGKKCMATRFDYWNLAGRCKKENRFEGGKPCEFGIAIDPNLKVAQGMTCPEVARLLGDAPRSVEYWVGRFERGRSGGIVGGGTAGAAPPPGRKTEGGGGSNFAPPAEGGWPERKHLGWKNTQHLD